jgi:hypothetical protein
MAHHRRAPGLVVGGQRSQPVAQAPPHLHRVVGEAFGGGPREPATGVLQRLRQVPVEQRGMRLDAGGQQLVDQAVVEVHARRVEGARTGGLHTRPRDREAVGIDAQRLHQRHVGGHAVVVVAGHLAGLAVAHLAGRGAEAVPDAFAAPVLAAAAFDLEGGRRNPPGERRRGLRGPQGVQGGGGQEAFVHERGPGVEG